MAEQEFTATESKNEGDKTIDTDQIETKHLSAVEENDDDDDDQTKKKQKATTTPPDGYTCKLCGVAGHWIQQCDLKTKQKKRKRNLDGNINTIGGNDNGSHQEHHEYRPGVDTSPKDIERAKEMQKLKPPNCDCGIPSRVKKVKRSHVTEGSRAIGSYFFFCVKKKDDSTKCNFAQPINELNKTKKEKVQNNFFAKKRKGFA